MQKKASVNLKYKILEREKNLTAEVNSALEKWDYYFCLF